MKKTACILSVLMVFSIVAVKPVSAKTFNIKNYGAKPNDKKADTRAIQAALDAAKGGGTVYIPKGTWYCSVVWLKGGTNIKCAKGAVLKMVKFKEHPEDAWVIYHSQKKRYSGFNKITIEGGTWDGGQHKDNAKNQHKTFEFDHGKNVTIKNMTIQNFSGLHLIEINACKNIKVDHVKFKNQYLYKGKAYSSISNWTVYNTDVVEFDSSCKGQGTTLPFDNTVCQNASITNCKFENVLSGCVTHHNQPQYLNYKHKNFTVANNTFKNIRGDAIHMNNVNGGKIINNKIDGVTRYVIETADSKNITVKNNTYRSYGSKDPMTTFTNYTIDKNGNEHYTAVSQ